MHIPAWCQQFKQEGLGQWVKNEVEFPHIMPTKPNTFNNYCSKYNTIGATPIKQFPMQGSQYHLVNSRVVRSNTAWFYRNTEVQYLCSRLLYPEAVDWGPIMTISASTPKTHQSSSHRYHLLCDKDSDFWLGWHWLIGYTLRSQVLERLAMFPTLSEGLAHSTVHTLWEENHCFGIFKYALGVYWFLWTSMILKRIDYFLMWFVLSAVSLYAASV